MRRAILRLGLLAALAGVLALFSVRHVFVIREIRVTGNDGIPAELVISASGLEPGQSMFRLNIETVKTGISALGTHAPESVARIWPDAVRLGLRPREKAAMALCTGGMALLDGECIVIDVLPDAPDCDLIYISGLEVQGARIGRRLGMTDAEAELCTTLLMAMESSGADAYVSEISLSDEGKARLILRSGCIAVLQDTEDLHAQMGWLRLLAQDMEHRGEHGGMLNISRAGCADYIPAE